MACIISAAQSSAARPTTATVTKPVAHNTSPAGLCRRGGVGTARAEATSSVPVTSTSPTMPSPAQSSGAYAHLAQPQRGKEARLGRSGGGEVDEVQVQGCAGGGGIAPTEACGWSAAAVERGGRGRCWD